MFNARLLTPILCVCCLATYNGWTLTQLARVSDVRSQAERASADLVRLHKQIALIKTLDVKSLPGRDIDHATMETMARWSHTKRDYGVVLSDVSATQIAGVGGQNVVPMSAMQMQHDATGLRKQEIVLKGTYESLEEFQQFLREQVIDAGASISAIKLKGYAFEIRIELFGEPVKATS